MTARTTRSLRLGLALLIALAACCAPALAAASIGGPGARGPLDGVPTLCDSALAPVAHATGTRGPLDVAVVVAALGVLAASRRGRSLVAVPSALGSARHASHLTPLRI